MSFLDMIEQQCFRRLGLLCQAVADVCSLLEQDLLPREPIGHALPMAVKVTTTLNFFTSGSFQRSAALISQSAAVGKCITQVTNVMFHKSANYVNVVIDEASVTERGLSFMALAGFPQMQDVSNCIHVAIKTPPHHPGVFVNCKGSHSLNVQLVCNNKKIIMLVCARFPGSCHDSLMLPVHPPSAFRTSKQTYRLAVWSQGLSTEDLADDTLRRPTNEAEELYNVNHMSTRCVREQAISMMKMRFRCLDRSGGALQYASARVSRMIMVCCVLQNIVQQ
uniref:putative nuclease HARBI1 n=1 Tax=Pristiophorus japonicus TaxID=55135 RepID=UPI00398F7F0E